MPSLPPSPSPSPSAAELGELLVREVCAAYGADSGWLAVLDDTEPGGTLRPLASTGLPPAAPLARRAVPTDAPVPEADAVSARRPRWFGSNAELAEWFPQHSATMRAHAVEAAAVLPLLADGRPIGVLTLGFRAPRHFDAGARALAESLAQECAQALARRALG